MSNPRLIIVGVLTALLTLLAAWQVVRARQVAACVNAGGSWNGAQSRCDAPRPGPILERDNLRRS